MGQSLLPSALSDLEGATHIGSLFEDKKGPYGGTPIAHGSGPLFMELLLFAPDKELLTRSLSLTVKHLFF